MRAAQLPRARRRRRARVRLLWQWGLLVLGLLLLGGTVLGLAFAGSPERLPAGTQIAGVDVSGLTSGEARSLLERKSRDLANDPAVFTAEGKTWRVKPNSVVVDVDWGAAVQAAQRQGEGFGPLRGLKRLGVRVFGGEVAPTSRVYQSAVTAYISRFARVVDRPRVEPSLRLKGYEAETVPGRSGHVIDRAAAETILVQGLTSLSREPVPLPLKIDRTHLTTRDLAGAEVKADTALSAPADIAYGPGGWHLSQRKISRLLALPKNGETDLRLEGPHAKRFFANLRKRVEHAPKDARFAIGVREHRPCRPRAGRAQARCRNHDAQHHGGAPLDVEPQGRPRGRDRGARADDARREGHGHHRPRRRLRDLLRRRGEPNPQRAARRAPDRRPLHPTRRDVLVQCDDRRALRGQGLPRGAGDHQRRAEDGARRRRLPGLDDDVQRRLRGRALDHRPDEPCAVHQPLPARPRRHGQLSGHRSQVRQRHRPLALDPDVRGLVLADRRALRHAAAQEGRERGRPARGDRARSRRSAWPMRT